MEPERRRHQFQPLRALRARASRQAGPRNTTQESSKFYTYTDTVTVGTVLFCDVWKDSRATSATLDVPTDEQGLQNHVTPRDSRPAEDYDTSTRERE